MKLSLCIPVMNQLEDTKVSWGCHLGTIIDKANTQIVVIDNGSTDGTQEFLERFIFPHFPDHIYHRNEENVGVLKSMNQCIEKSNGDVVAILHNDVNVFEIGWDKRVMGEFYKDQLLGLAGFLGAQGCMPDGGRMNTVSNLLEAEIHGERVTGTKRVAIFDGLSLIGRRKMFEEVDGFDTDYTYHHFYDRDISLESLFAGWHNLMIGVLCHHRSGVTANRPEYQTWISQKMGTEGFTGDKASYDASDSYFKQKWASKLPILVKV